MFGVLTCVGLLITVCVQLSIAANRDQHYTLRREGYKLRVNQHLTLQEVSCSSLAACAAVCTHTTDCLAVSYQGTGRRCVLAVGHIDNFIDLTDVFGLDSGWISMIKRVFTVYQLRSPLGVYEASFNDSVALCSAMQTTLASPADLLESKALGLTLCKCGWMSNGNRVYVMQDGQGTSGCHDNPGYLTNCDSFSKANAWCRL